MPEWTLDQLFKLLLVLLSARLTVEQVAHILHTTPEGVYVLTRRRLLRVLGRPPANGTKYYSRDYILRLSHDEGWLARASDTLVAYKWDKNHANKGT
jgi:hypothetical protein